ncbi:CsgG/HfaB family protein [Desulfobacterium sp. N47]|uniref:CsgG/HfaB family protein n=1 Tax=Desulfobacterium sp. N47 TaxID=3115210 RepID=UPI003F4A3F4D
MKLIKDALTIAKLNSISLLIIFTIMCLFVLPKILYASSVKDIAVLPFKNITGNSGCNIEDSVTEMLMTELAKNKNFHIVERQRLTDILKETKLQMSGLTDPANALKFGKMTGAKYLISGNITLCATEESKSSFIISYGKQKSNVELKVRVIDLETGIAIGGSEGKGSSDRSSTSFDPSVVGLNNLDNISSGTKSERAGILVEAASQAVTQLNNNLKALFPLEGYIIKKDGDTVIIDIGKGLVSEGSRFEVFQMGEELIHPVTKKKLGQEKTKVGEITVDKVLDEFSYAKTTPGNEKIKVGNIVTLSK